MGWRRGTWWCSMWWRVGSVKKWNGDKARGIIREEGGEEWSFKLEDCLDNVEEGFILYSKGDRVSFRASRGDRRNAVTPRAVEVQVITEGENDSLVQSVELPTDETCEGEVNAKTGTNLNRPEKETPSKVTE